MPTFNGTTGSPSSGLYLIISYEVGAGNVASNTTPVTVSMQLHHGGLQVGAGTNDCEVHVGSQVYKWTGPDIYSSGGTVDLGSHTFSVTHNPDGTWSGEIGASYRLGIIYGSAGYVGTISGKQTVTLPTIPRASSISAADANIESKSTIVIVRKAPAFTHTIQYTFGSLTGYIGSDGAAISDAVKMTETTILFAVPGSFYSQIPDSKSGVCNLICCTYDGDTQIGDAQTESFTVTAAESLCAPELSGTVRDINRATMALTGDVEKLVRFYSTALCKIDAEAKNDAKIVSKKIAGTEVNTSTLRVENVEIDTFSFSAMDSRGYSASATVKKPIVPYIRLTCNARGYRPNPTDGSGRVEISGQYYDGSFGAVENALSLRYRVSDGQWQDAAPTISGNSYSAVVELTGLTYTQSFTISISASDRLSSAEREVTIHRGIPVFDWGKDDFRFHVPISSEITTVEMEDDRFERLLYTAAGNVCTIYGAVKATTGDITAHGFPPCAAPYVISQRMTASDPCAPTGGAAMIDSTGQLRVFGASSEETRISVTYVCKYRKGGYL